MAGTPWSAEEDEFLRACYAAHGNGQLMAMMEERGWHRTCPAIMGRAKKLGLAKDPSLGYRKEMPATTWTPEMVAWFRAYATDRLWDEVRDEARRLFGVDLTRSAIQNARHRFAVTCSIRDAGRFQPGHVPANKGKTWDEYVSPQGQERSRATCFRKGELRGSAAERVRPLLDTRETPYGVEIKVRPRDAAYPMRYWIPLGEFEWMRANGRDWPEGCVCVHADHDAWNNDPENIVPVPRDLYPLVTGANPSALPYHDRETLETAIMSARVTRARYDALEKASYRRGQAMEAGRETHVRRNHRCRTNTPTCSMPSRP